MSRRTAEANKAILAAWNNEQELVKAGKGTREWTPEQQKDILDRGKAYDDEGVAFQGQHMKSAEKYPEYQGDPGNIQFLTREEHLEAHNGNWRNPTNGYYNPVTKEMIDFGDGPYIPCKIILLSEPITVSQIEQNQEPHLDNEFTEDIRTQTNETVKINSQPKMSDVQNEQQLNLEQKLKHGIRNIKNTVIDFSEKKPKTLKIAGAVGIFAIGLILNNKTTGSGSSSPGNVSRGTNKQDNNSNSYDNSHIVNQSDNNDKKYTPNDVPAGKQRYHYKDGRVDWVNKDPYHRSGKDKK